VLLTRHRRQNGQALSRGLDTVSPEEIRGVVIHDFRISPILDYVKNFTWFS
jgi:hypothetical protein